LGRTSRGGSKRKPKAYGEEKATIMKGGEFNPWFTEASGEEPKCVWVVVLDKVGTGMGSRSGRRGEKQSLQGNERQKERSNTGRIFWNDIAGTY